MPKIAQIIVDVPLLQTDKPFSYLIPREFESLVSKGMRVHVPFGKGNRLLQGIVIGIVEKKEIENLKEIKEVLDLEAVLSEEQLMLSDKMRQKVFSYKISILKAMLPNLLNSSYDKLLIAEDGSVSYWSELSQKEQLEKAKLVSKGLLKVSYKAQSRETRKIKKFILVNKTALSLFDIGKKAKKRQEFKDFLLNSDQRLEFSEMIHQFSRAVVNFFIEYELVKVEEIEVNRLALEKVKRDEKLTLNLEQERVFQTIIKNEKKNYLLEGVTGSGKTEVYLQVIASELEKGKTAIMLLTEISLTSQIAKRFIARFSDKVALLHSRLSDGERYDEWRRIKKGEARIVVGTRSAIFAPLENIGVIIIDEEHDSSYKQESSPRYHARDVALERVAYHQAKLILGSATPCLETRARADRAYYQLLEMKERANPLAQLAQVKLIDMKKSISPQSLNFSQELLEKIEEKLKKKEQIILLLNRRGYSSFVMCRDCAFVVNCQNCDVSLTLHMDSKTLNCHYCGHKERIPDTCPSCKSKQIRYYGTGTQKIEEELEKFFPEARILRMDVDTTSKKGAHERILTTFANEEADILLGTQMIAKGLDFPNVTLVGVINADTCLNLPDFRASEKTFQLLTQVSGRSGRAEKRGEVMIQTFNPDHYAIQLAKTQDYESFYKTEMKFRRLLSYSPYWYSTQLVISDKEEDNVVKKSYEIISLLKKNLTEKAIILGPVARPIARTHQLYHYQILIKYRFEERLETVLNQLLDWSQESENKSLRVIIDSEPINFI
ncbi:MAG: primosomal protein N' [Lactovum sp.]